MAYYGRPMTQEDWEEWYDEHEDEIREEMALGERDSRGRPL